MYFVCMQKNLLQRSLAIAILTFLSISSAFAQNESKFVGKWKMTSETDSDPVVWNLVLTQTDGKLAAMLSSDQGEIAPKDFSYEGGVLKFKASYEDRDYDIELKLNGADLDGTWSGEGASGKIHGVKA